MSSLQPGNMIYNCYGNSGLKVSAISIGNMVNYKPETYEEDKKIIETALKNGINFFDTAEVYASGESEKQLGKILQDLKVPRQEIVIATKINIANNPDMNSDRTTNRKHIKESIKKCLERLQVDTVDILYAHLHDHATPLEQICRSFHEVVEEGHAYYWATSNWDAEVVYNALAICEKLNLHKPIGGQNQYNMLVRNELEVDYESLFTKYNYGLIGWSPLAGGFLTGKYINGIPKEEVVRANDTTFWFPIELTRKLFYDSHATEKTTQKLKDLTAIAEKEGYKLTHLAIAWVLKYKHIDSALIGARTAAQLEDSLKALELVEKLTPELEGEINKILDTHPTPRMNFLKWTPYPNARPLAK